MITYVAYDSSREYGVEVGVTLSAKSDAAARREAQDVSKKEGWEEVAVMFHRDSDGCRGEL